MLDTSFYGRPWAILPETLSEIEAAYRAGRITPQAGSSARPAARPAISGGGVAYIGVLGGIVHRQNFLSMILGWPTVQGLKAQLRAALDDPGVKSILLDVDSPGGTTDAIGELAGEIFAARNRKRIVAVANGLAASAAYWVAAAATEFVASPSALVGAIGVYALHLDYSRQLDQRGVKPTFVYAGENKVEGNDLEPLSDSARAHIQGLVDETYDQFVGDVARFRGVNPRTVRSGFGQGRVVTATQARAAGMVDRIATLDATVERIVHGMSASSRNARYEREMMRSMGAEAFLQFKSEQAQRRAAQQADLRRVRLLLDGARVKELTPGGPSSAVPN